MISPRPPLLLDLLDIKGATITMDAIGCEFAIADKIVEEQQTMS